MYEPNRFTGTYYSMSEQPFFIEAPGMQVYDCSKLVNEAEKTSSWNAEEDTLYNQHWFISGSVDMHESGMLVAAMFFEEMGQSVTL